jgi:pyrimidine-nucleoside phosphorylase
VPKLGVPGRPAGGIDCLGQIPGYRTSLSADEVKHVLGWSGYAHFLAEGQFAPLDGKLFRLRQSEGAQAVPTLVSASLIAKKIAVGVKSVGLDIRVASHGNFGDSWDIAKRNARLFVDCAKLVGIEAHPVLTDARFPCQPFFGRRESLVALSEIFGGKMSPWLRHHVDICRTLAMVCVSEGRSKSISSAGPDILRRHFNENIEAQGGLVGDFEKLVAATRGEHSIILRAIKAGFCRYPLKELRDAFVAWQKRSECPSSPFPDPVGLVFLHPPGTWVGKNEGVATLRADASVLSEAIDQLTKLVCIPSTHPLGLGVEGLNE